MIFLIDEKDIIMPYGQFESVGKVAKIFKIKVKDTPILKEVGKFKIEVPDYKMKEIENSLYNSTSFRNEAAICNKIITPILEVVVAKYKPLDLWIEEPFNVDEKSGLIGSPDYLLAPKTDEGDMGLPPLCVIEAKDEKWKKGWAQALAEMVAVSKLGAEVCYGVVTTGRAWEFASRVGWATYFCCPPFNPKIFAVVKLKGPGSNCFLNITIWVVLQ